MNRIYRSIWNERSSTFVATPENASGESRKSSPGAGPGARAGLFTLNTLSLCLMLALGADAYALPTGAAVSAGSASIAGSAAKLTIHQSSQNLAINWQSFNIGAAQAVQFVQPNASSVALNRVLGADPSAILGSLSANGKVFLVNPNGILFGKGAQVNVGALVASTRNITDSDFMAGNYRFSGSGNGAILNQGSINAEGGYVALLGASVSNEGVILARLGTVALAAGNAMTLDLAGDGLLNVMVNQGALNALVHNGGLIRADGGQVLLSAQAAGNLLQSAVNNTGVIQAQTIENRNGTIKLLGSMLNGTMNVGGTLDASAPNGGNGGFIETSAAKVIIASDAKVTTFASLGQTGTWRSVSSRRMQSWVTRSRWTVNIEVLRSYSHIEELPACCCSQVHQVFAVAKRAERVLWSLLTVECNINLFTNFVVPSADGWAHPDLCLFHLPARTYKQLDSGTNDASL